MSHLTDVCLLIQQAASVFHRSSIRRVGIHVDQTAGGLFQCRHARHYCRRCGQRNDELVDARRVRLIDGRHCCRRHLTEAGSVEAGVVAVWRHGRLLLDLLLLRSLLLLDRHQLLVWQRYRRQASRTLLLLHQAASHKHAPDLHQRHMLSLPINFSNSLHQIYERH